MVKEKFIHDILYSGVVMRGFVLKLNRAKNEDMIATVLSDHHIRSYYRFYGARHSILQLGYLIDFESDGDDARFMPRIRSLRHFGFPWLYDRNRLMIWHDWIKLFEPHLRDTEELEPFYYELLLNAAKHWDKQNPKRIILESYHALLSHEGRLHPIEQCFICEASIADEISLMATFRPAHPDCIYAPALSRDHVETFLTTGKTLHLSDTEVDVIYEVVKKGL
jgi:hypothetical protein